MSKKPRPESRPAKEPRLNADAIATVRARSPSTVNFDGASTWSPSNFRKTLDLTKMFGNATINSPKLDKLVEESSRTPLSFPTLVGSKDYADVIFHVGNHALYAHRAIIESRCAPLFAVAVKDRGKKGHLTTLKTDEKLVDIRSLTLVLEYLYTGAVPFSDVTPAEVISLIAHSELYEIDRLRWLCERYLNSVLNQDLFFSLLLLSDVSGVARAKKLCLQYGALHFEELIVRKEQVHTLGIELFREFVCHATLNHETTEDLEQVSFPNTIREEFKIIFTAMQHPDAFFTFKSASTTIPCHKAVLYAQSERFKTLFLEDGPSVDGRYTLPKNIAMPHEAFKSFLGWAYYRDTSFSAAHAAEMLPLAHDFGIDALVDECASKLRRGISIQSVIPILGLCYSEWGKIGYKKELAQPCLDFVVLHFDRIDLSPLKSAAIAAAIAEAVRKAVVEGIWVTLSGDSSSAPNGHASSSSPATPHTPHSPNTPRSSHRHSHQVPNGVHDADVTESSTATDSVLELDSSERKSFRRGDRSKKRRTITIDPVAAQANGIDSHVEDSGSQSPATPNDAAEPAQKSAVVEEKASTPKPVSEAPAATTAATAATTNASDADESKTTPAVESAPAPAAEAEEAPKPAAEEKKAEPAEKPVEKPVEKVEKTTEKEEKVEKVEKAEKATEKVEKAEKAEKSEKSEDKKESKSTPRSERKNGEAKSSSSTKDSDGSTTPKKDSPSTSKKSKKDSSATSSTTVTDVPVSTEESSDRKRPGLEPSTSVKAIKESFEAKGREEEEKTAREALVRRKSGQSSSDSLKASLESPKVERKQKS